MPRVRHRFLEASGWGGTFVIGSFSGFTGGVIGSAMEGNDAGTVLKHGGIAAAFGGFLGVGIRAISPGIRWAWGKVWPAKAPVLKIAPDADIDPAKVAARGNEVVKLESGPFEELARRSVRDGLTPDHIPSFASIKMNVERELKRTLTSAEEAILRNETNAIVVRTRSHMDVSRTYGGRNTPDQILQDSLDLQRAFQLDQEAWLQRLLDEGHTLEEILSAFKKLDELNRNAGRY